MAVAAEKVGEDISFRLMERERHQQQGGRLRQAVNRARDFVSAHHPQQKDNNFNNLSDPLEKNHSYYHKNCFTTNNNLYNPYNKKVYNKNTNSFIDSIDDKLQNLKDGSKIGNNQRRSTKTSLENRPMFVTTVKTGIFLDPPPELAAILGLQSSTNSTGSTASDEEVLLYSFSSRPRVLNTRNNNIHNHHHHHHHPQSQPHHARCTQSKPKNMNNEQDVKQQTRNRAKREIKDVNYKNKHEYSSSNTSSPSKKSGDNKDILSYGNIMYDRRVVRGSTIVSHTGPPDRPKWNSNVAHAKIPSSEAGAQTNAARIAEARRRTMARKRAQGQATRALKMRLGTPPPVEGRKHEDIQTDVYLEELFDHPKEEHVAVQTEPFLDRPPTPPFVPAKTGIDISTQIYPGDLFDFDIEVQPILEVLVGKTVEQALIEVLEEDELASIKEQQRRYREIRAAEKAEEERLEEEERRRRQEKERRVAEHLDACRLQKETEERVAAAVLTTGYIADLLPSVLEGLKQAGYLVDDIKEDVEENFMGWLMEEVKSEMQRMVENRELLSEIVREILEARAALYAGQNEESKRPSSADDFDKNPLPEPDMLGDYEEKAEEEGRGMSLRYDQ